MINFSRAFDSAWQRTQVLLFRPFDPAKWIVIGFNAFLVLLAEGGITFNEPFYTQSSNDPSKYESLTALASAVNQEISWFRSILFSHSLVTYLGLGTLTLLAWLVLSWAGCRGEFLFLDNLVRNRPAIAEPWRRYAREGNVWFLFHLVLTAVYWILLFGLLIVAVALNWSWIRPERDPNAGEIAILGCVLLMGCLFFAVYAACTFLLQSLVVPLLFRQTFGFWKALEAVGRLATEHPLSILVYLGINFALALGATLLALVVFCLLCCVVGLVALVPYVGSLLLMLLMGEVLLPLFVYCRCFQLDCLAQFGAEYDVWIVDVPGAPAPTLPPPRE